MSTAIGDRRPDVHAARHRRRRALAGRRARRRSSSSPATTAPTRWRGTTASLAVRARTTPTCKVLAVSPNDAERYPRDSFDAMRERVAADGGWPLPYLHDESQEVARAYDAKTTPDCFVIDADGTHRLPRRPRRRPPGPVAQRRVAARRDRRGAGRRRARPGRDRSRSAARSSGSSDHAGDDARRARRHHDRQQQRLVAPASMRAKARRPTAWPTTTHPSAAASAPQSTSTSAVASTGASTTAAMIPRPRKAALSESRISAGPSPRWANHKRDRRAVDARRRAQRAGGEAERQSRARVAGRRRRRLVPRPGPQPRGADDRHADRDLQHRLRQRAQHEHAAHRPGHRGDEDRADLAPRHARAPALAEEHEPVEREPEHGDGHDRALGLEQREHRRAEDEREPEAGRGLHDGRGQRHDREEEHYPTTPVGERPSCSTSIATGARPARA